MTRMDQDYADEFDKMIAEMKAHMKAIAKHATGPEKERIAKAETEIAEYEKKGKELIAMILTGKDAVTVDSEFKGIEVPLDAGSFGFAGLVARHFAGRAFAMGEEVADDR
jgi:hypothetical protein